MITNQKFYDLLVSREDRLLYLNFRLEDGGFGVDDKGFHITNPYGGMSYYQPSILKNLEMYLSNPDNYLGVGIITRINLGEGDNSYIQNDAPWTDKDTRNLIKILIKYNIDFTAVYPDIEVRTSNRMAKCRYTKPKAQWRDFHAE